LGRLTRVYDPFYAPDETVWLRQYDFVTASEVLEHLHRPAAELDRLFGVLKPGGWLGVMTQPWREPDALPTWSYLRDPTHVCFYSRPVFEYIAARWRAEPAYVGDDVVLLRRRD